MIHGVEKNKVGGYSFFMHLPDNADATKSKIDPTIVDGDIMIKKDSGIYANLTNLPVVDLVT